VGRNKSGATIYDKMEIVLREDLDPDTDFYYLHQFKIYHDSYLIWDTDTWEAVLSTCTVYRIEVDGKYAGDVILEDKGKGTKSIIDFSVLPNTRGEESDGQFLKKSRKWTESSRPSHERRRLIFF